MSFIQNHMQLCTISQMCKAIKFSRNTYYKALLNKPSNKKKEYETFSEKVMEYYLDSKKRYGAVKLCKMLNDNGIPCNVKRVQRHMKRLGIHSIVIRKYKYNANHGSVPDDKENILKRDFTTKTINEK